MANRFTALDFRQIGVMLRGEPEPINRWVQEINPSRTGSYITMIVAATGLYGAAMGYWRDPYQALYTGIKLPLIILLTTLGNGLLNGMLAPLLGLNLGFRQSLQAVLMSFTIFAVIMGAFSPLILFLDLNVPPISSKGIITYDCITLVHVVIFAFAGITANLRLAELLERLGGSRQVGRRVLLAWLAGNLFLGSQLSWICRPFIGTPDLAVGFLRGDAFAGSFYETVFHIIRKLFFQ